VALLGEAIQIEDVLADREYVATPGQQVGGYRTIVGVPIQQDGTTSGVLALTRNEVDPFSDAEQALATGFAEQAAVGVANARLLRRRAPARSARLSFAPGRELVSSPEGEAPRRATAARSPRCSDLRSFTSLDRRRGAGSAPVPRWSGRCGRARRHSAFRGRRDHDVLQRPGSPEDHAARALRMALAIRERFVEISEGGAGADMSSGWNRSRPATDDAGSGSRSLRLRRVGNAIILASRMSGEAEANDPHRTTDVRRGRRRPDRG
jgi:hypothetical protein